MDLGVCIFEGIPRRGRWLFQLLWRPIAKGSRHKWNCQWGGDCKLQNAAAISESWPGNWKQKHWLFQIFTFLALQLSKGRWFTKYCTISIFKFWIGGQIRSLLPKKTFWELLIIFQPLDHHKFFPQKGFYSDGWVWQCNVIPHFAALKKL